jgi:membrane protein involved in colicin uptake
MGKNSSPKQSGSANDLRLDPADGQRLTWEELQQKYATQYNAFQIGHYWYNECRRVPKAAAKTKPVGRQEEAQPPGPVSQSDPDQEAASKAKVEEFKARAESAIAKAKMEEETAAQAKAEQEAAAQAQQEAAAKAKAEQEAAAKAEQEAAAKAVEEVEAKAKAEVAAFKEMAKAEVAEAKAKNEKKAAVEAPEIDASKAVSEAAPQAEVHVKGPASLWSVLMVSLGEFTHKFCNGSCHGVRAKKEIAVDVPLRQQPEQLVGA